MKVLDLKLPIRAEQTKNVREEVNGSDRRLQIPNSMNVIPYEYEVYIHFPS